MKRRVSVCRDGRSNRMPLVLVRLLSVVLVGCFLSPPIMAPCLAQSLLRPVILVHGLGGSKEASWGWGRPRSFFSRLVDAGYVPGKTLYAFDYSANACGDYVELASDLAAFIDEVKAVSGYNKVDVVCHSMGGLVARKYVASEEYRGDIQNLIMISTPNRGSFAASAAALMHQLLTLESEGDGIEHLSPRQLQVKARAASVYEPLYAEFAAVRNWDRPGLHTIGQTFEEWLVETYPAIVQEILCGRAQTASVADGKVPNPEEGLTDGYYEYVALNMGRRAYQMRLTLKAPRPAGLLGHLLDWSSILVEKLRVLGILARVRPWLERQAFYALGRALNINPSEPALMRLVEEKLKFPVGRKDARILYDALPANWYLASWNEEDLRRRHEAVRNGDTSVPRNVIVAARATNVPRLAWNTVDENDLAVEVDSCYLEPFGDDVYEIIEGPAMFHGMPLSDVQLAARVVGWLCGMDREAIRGPNWQPGEGPTRAHAEGTLLVSDWSPSYLRFDPADIGETCDLLVEIEEQGSDERYVAWVDLELEHGTRREWLLPAKPFVIRGLGREVKSAVLGARLEPCRGTAFRESIGSLRYGIVASKEEILPVSSEAGMAPVTASPRPGNPAAFAANTKHIVVSERRSTTQKRASGGEFRKVDWDFGDGTTMKGQPEKATEHCFAESGHFRVTGTVRDEWGEVLEKWQWAVDVDDPGKAETFATQPVKVDAPGITISGPVKWVTGRPARFRVEVCLDGIAGAEVVAIDPGSEFAVTWLKPGKHSVKVAVTVRYRLTQGSAEVAALRTYVRTTTVEVLTTAATG